MALLSIQDARPINHLAPWLRAFQPRGGRSGIIGRIQRVPVAKTLRVTVREYAERVKFNWTNPDAKMDVTMLGDRQHCTRLTFWEPIANALVQIPHLEVVVSAIDTHMEPFHLWADRADILGSDGKPLPHSMSVDKVYAWNKVPTTIDASGYRHYKGSDGQEHEVKPWDLAFPTGSITQEFSSADYPEAFAKFAGAGPLVVMAELVYPWAATPQNIYGFTAWGPFQPQVFSGWTPMIKGKVEIEVLP